MNTSRRRFLGQLALASAGFTAIRCLKPFSRSAFAMPPLAVTGNPLRFPAAFAGGDLVAKVASINIWSDAPTSLMTFDGSFPGPTIKVGRGDTLSVRLVNHLSEPTNIHWHGLLAPADMDGYPGDLVQPGASKLYSFTVDQPAGTYWYHPHPDKLTAKQAYLGMAGFLIVEDDAEAALGLPSGQYDVPLAIQDRRVGTGRTITYNPSMADVMTGMLGGTMLVNGTPEAYLEVSRDIYRLRLLNGSNARIMKLGFADGKTFHLIASDGGLLDKPYEVSSFWLAPGGRAEILVNFMDKSIGGSRILRTLPYDNAPDPSVQGWGMDIIRFDVTQETHRSYSIPTTLRPFEQLDPSQAVASRSFALGMIMSGMEMLHTINGRAFDMNRIDQHVQAGSIEVWEFVNDGDEPHPIHFHGARFQVISRGGSASLSPEDLGWKDVVIVDMQSSAKVAVRFGTDTGTYLMHCHNLEHEDSGMMINYAVESTTGVGAESGEAAIDLVHPNPARDVVTIPIRLARTGMIVLGCYAIDGRLIRRVASGEYAAGGHAFELNVRDFPPGTYRVELAAGRMRSSQWLVVVR